MTSATATGLATAGQPRRAGLGHLMLAEWTKIRTVRSTVWSMIVLVVVTLGFTSLFTALTAANWAKTPPDRMASIIHDPVGFILGAGFGFGQLAICVLGVLVISSEYSTGAIRASLLAVPKRIPMVGAKAVVFAALIFVVGEIVAFGCYFIGAAIMHSHVPVALSDPGNTRAVIGAGLYLTVLSLFAMAIGGIVRNTAGAITGVIAFVLVIAPLLQLLPGSWGKHIHGYMPSEAGVLIAQAHPAADAVLSPWQGFGVFCLWTAVLLAAAITLLKTRDA